MSNTKSDFEKAVHAFDKMYDAAFVAEMLKTLEKSGVALTPETEEKLYEAAKNFRESKLGKTLEQNRKETLGRLTP